MCDERQREGRIPEISFVLSSLIEVFSCLYEAARQASTDLPACLNPFAAKQQARGFQPLQYMSYLLNKFRQHRITLILRRFN